MPRRRCGSPPCRATAASAAALCGPCSPTASLPSLPGPSWFCRHARRPGQAQGPSCRLARPQPPNRCLTHKQSIHRQVRSRAAAASSPGAKPARPCLLRSTRPGSAPGRPTDSSRSSSGSAQGRGCRRAVAAAAATTGRRCCAPTGRFTRFTPAPCALPRSAACNEWCACRHTTGGEGRRRPRPPRPSARSPALLSYCSCRGAQTAVWRWS